MSFKPPNFLTRVNYSAPVIKTDSGQRRSCEMMKMLPVSFLLVLVSQIFLTTVIVRYDHMEKYTVTNLCGAMLLYLVSDRNI